MTFWELVRALLRNWPIVLVGGVLTAGSGLVAISDPGVHFTRTELVFLAPTSTFYPNAIRTQSTDIIVTAGLVAKRVTGPGKVSKFASPDVTLVGLGVRDGWSLRLPDTGGQWATNFATQRLLLDIVGPDDVAVRQRQSELIQRVQEALKELQDERNAGPNARITSITAPQSTTIYSVGVNRPRALGMTALLGIGTTIAVVIFREYWRRRRAEARAAKAASAAAASVEEDPEQEQTQEEAVMV